MNAEDPHDEIYYVPLLSFAVAGGHFVLAERLIRRGAQVAPYSAQLLGLAARLGGRALVDLLLDNGADARALGAGIFVDVSDLGLLTYLLSCGLSAQRNPNHDLPPV